MIRQTQELLLDSVPAGVGQPLLLATKNVMYFLSTVWFSLLGGCEFVRKRREATGDRREARVTWYLVVYVVVFFSSCFERK